MALTTEGMPTAQQIAFEKIRLNVEAAVSDTLLDARVVCVQDWFADHARLQLSGFLWGKTIEEHEIRYPLDWWEAVKDRWAPRCFLRRWPVRHQTKTIALKAIWPTLRLMVPDHEPRLVMLVNGSSVGGYPEKQ